MTETNQKAFYFQQKIKSQIVVIVFLLFHVHVEHSSGVGLQRLWDLTLYMNACVRQSTESGEERAAAVTRVRKDKVGVDPAGVQVEPASCR